MGKRLASQCGQFVIGEGVEVGVSVLPKEDPRHFRMPGRPDNVYGACMIAATWNPPDQRNLTQPAKYGTLGLGLKVVRNVFREFRPSVRGKFARS